MIFLGALAASSIQHLQVFRSLEVLDLDERSGRLDAYAVVTDKHAARLTKARTLSFPAGTRFEGGKKVFVSPDGTRIALIVRDATSTRTIILSPSGFRILRSVPTPDAVQASWSPDSDHLAFQTLARGDGGVISVSSARSVSLPKIGAFVWSKRGDSCYVRSADNGSLSSAGASWQRIDVRTGKSESAYAKNVAAESWLGALGFFRARKVPLDFNPSEVWTSHGCFLPYFEYDREKPAQDLVILPSGPCLVRRPNVVNLEFSCLWPDVSRLYYLQDDVLFDKREAPPGTRWIGLMDPRVRAREQYLIHLPSALERAPLFLAKA